MGVRVGLRDEASRWPTACHEKILDLVSVGWTWSSARHYATGEECGVEIESRWPSRKEREKGRAPAFVCGESMGQPPNFIEISALLPYRRCGCRNLVSPVHHIEP